jgi:hypothetical protein
MLGDVMLGNNGGFATLCGIRIRPPFWGAKRELKAPRIGV